MSTVVIFQNQTSLLSTQRIISSWGYNRKTRHLRPKTVIPRQVQQQQQQQQQDPAISEKSALFESIFFSWALMCLVFEHRLHRVPM